MASLESKFDYAQLDEGVSAYLLKKESSMREIVGKAYTELGRELKEAQDELSNHGYGCFEEWYTSLGFKKDRVYSLIQRFDLIVGNSDKRELLEDLPVSLSYEIAKPNADSELKQKVLNGDITSHKQYKELEFRIKQSEKRAADLEKQLDIAKRIPVKETVEVISGEVQEKIKDLKGQLLGSNNMLKKAEQELSTYRLRDTSEFDEEAARKQREKLQHEADIKTIDLRVAFKRFIENAAISSVLYGAIANASTTEKKHLTEMVEMAEKVIHDTKLALSGRKEIEQ